MTYTLEELEQIFDLVQMVTNLNETPEGASLFHMLHYRRLDKKGVCRIDQGLFVEIYEVKLFVEKNRDRAEDLYWLNSQFFVWCM